MYSHKTYRCMCICTDDKHRERTKEKERRDIRRKKLSHSKGMNGLQRKREKKSNKKKMIVYVEKRLCSMLIGEQALFFFCVQ